MCLKTMKLKDGCSFCLVQDNLEQTDIGMRLSGLPDNVAIVAGPRSQREASAYQLLDLERVVSGL